VRHERLNQELTEDTGDGLNLNILGGTSLNPIPGLSPGLVQGEQTALAATLDQLIGFGNELGAGGQEPREGDLSLVEDILNSLVIGEVKGGETSRRVVCCGGRKRGRLNDLGASEVVVEDGLAVGLEDRFGGHDMCVCVYEELRENERREERQEGMILSWKVRERRGKGGKGSGVYSVHKKKSCSGDYSVQLGRSHLLRAKNRREDQKNKGGGTFVGIPHQVPGTFETRHKLHLN
jgi:hypothetical protein